MEKQNELNELEQRKNNFEQIIYVCEYEIAKILERIETLTKRTPIWFIYKTKSNEEKPREKGTN